MFTNLHTAKRVGAISFIWTDTAVIVCGLPSLFGDTEVLGVCLVTTTGSGDHFRSVMEYDLAIECGILTENRIHPWMPPEFGV